MAENKPVLSAYGHELNGAGTACAPDCPACRWAAEKAEAEAEAEAKTKKQPNRVA